jgi:hypothetical protein
VSAAGNRERNGRGNGSGTRRASRLPIVAAMVVGIVAAGALRHVAIAHQERSTRAVAAGSGSGPRASALGSMNSFALALLLGGLRGPLAMILWATSEAQKTERNLEDFDTKVEWIRLLQPEFDTVHLFQIWNKAYNISVQMASLPNRYATILDALEYASDVDKERGGNVNIMNAVAQVYSNKLGTVHSEKTYYRRMVREQSFVPPDWKGPDDPRTADRTGQAGWQRRRMDPKLDPKGNILPELLVATAPRPADLPPNQDWNDGSELQYLKKYQPFPDGLSPYALAYNYSKRAQVLMTVGKQSPLQLSAAVIDSRPGMELNLWAHDEWDRGRQFELQAWGAPPQSEKLAMEMATAGLPPDRPLVNAAAAETALTCYRRAAQVALDSIVEFRRHQQNPEYMDRGLNFESHMDDMAALAPYMEADHDYLKAATAGAQERETLLRRAADNYQKAIGAYQLIALRYYIDDGVAARAFPKDVTRATIHTSTNRQQQDEIMNRVRQEHQKVGLGMIQEEYMEYETYINRATTRLGQLLRR